MEQNCPVYFDNLSVKKNISISRINKVQHMHSNRRKYNCKVLFLYLYKVKIFFFSKIDIIKRMKAETLCN